MDFTRGLHWINLDATEFDLLFSDSYTRKTSVNLLTDINTAPTANAHIAELKMV